MTTQNPKTQKTLSPLERTQRLLAENEKRQELKATARRLLLGHFALSCSEDFRNAHSWACTTETMAPVFWGDVKPSHAIRFNEAKIESDKLCADLVIFLDSPFGNDEAAHHAVTTLPKLAQVLEDQLPSLLREYRIHSGLMMEVHKAVEGSVDE